jgi:hypothetical protein
MYFSSAHTYNALPYFDLILQTQDFKIRYTSISRLFILPKSSTPHTLVVVGLDPPIRKGQTYYSYLLCQVRAGGAGGGVWGGGASSE